jgi:hypothetical protein
MSFSENFINKHKNINIRGAALINDIEKILEEKSELIYYLPISFSYDIEALQQLKKALENLGLYEMKANKIYRDYIPPKNMFYFFESNEKYSNTLDTWTYDYKPIQDLSKVSTVSGIAINLA